VALSGRRRDPEVGAVLAPSAVLAREHADAIDAWLMAAVERHGALSFSELRKGVQALSARYVEQRRPEGVKAGALGSPAKRAAFATFYAGLHLQTVLALAPSLIASLSQREIRRVVDLGAGTGVVGCGLALALGPPAPQVLALERSTFALGEARATFKAFRTSGRTRRTALPAGLPRLGRGDLLAAGWFLNECRPEQRERLVEQIEAALDAGAAAIVLEPLSGRAVPWWDEVTGRLASRGVHREIVKWHATLPDWLRQMDRAAALRHQELGARVAWGPLA
jgi:hypothetical protein